MTDPRIYTSRRLAIAEAIAAKFNEEIAGGNRSDIKGRATTKLKFWDEVKEFPGIFVTPGSETRQYQGGGYKDRFMTLTIRCYVREENSLEALENLIEDIETSIETNSKLAYTDKDGNAQYTHQFTILSITTDEGVLAPLAVGEIVCEVRY